MGMRKLWSVLLCIMLLFAYIPVGWADESSADANLKSLAVDGYDLAPDFDTGTTEYAVSIPNEVESVEISAVTADENAALTINGKEAVSDEGYEVGSLFVGDNEVDVEVRAADGSTVQTYTITIMRADKEENTDENEEENLPEEPVPGDDASLRSLSVKDYELNESFVSDTMAYTVAIPNEVESAEIIAVTADENAALTINGEKAVSGEGHAVGSLLVGENTVDVEVTAADGTTVQTYTITIIRAGKEENEENLPEEPEPGDDAYLRSLIVTDYELNESFVPDTMRYTVDIPNEVESVKIIAVTADKNAALTINGKETVSGEGHAVGSLLVGDNTVDVEVSASDGSTVQNYTIVIKRAIEAPFPKIRGGNPLPQTPLDYAASDYARYADKMAVGEQHIAVVDANGRITLGGDSSQEQCELPAGLSGLKVKAVAAGAYHTLALTENGWVYAWGKSSCDTDYTLAPVSIPAEVEAVQNEIKLIAAGASMSAVVTTSNEVIIWGYNNNELEQIPDGLGNVVDIALTNNCAVTLDDKGDVRVWGDQSCTTIPKDLDRNVVAIAVGQYHWLALTNDGKVSITGHKSNLKRCQQIKNQVGVRAIIGGRQFAGAILADGSVWGWGTLPNIYNESGEELISASDNIRAFTCMISPGLDSFSSSICAMQGDGTIKMVASDEFNIDPISDEFNFVGESDANALLSSLAVKYYTMSPEFNAGTLEYTVAIPHDVSSVEITAETADDATLTINGVDARSGEVQAVDNLVVGDNIVKVVVGSADGKQSNEYTITITRAAAGGNGPRLNSLIVTGGILSPEFKADIFEYTVDLPHDVSCVEITAATAEPDTSLYVNDVEAESGTAVKMENLTVGTNTVTVKVSAAGVSTDYTINIRKAGEGELPQTPEAYADSRYAQLAARLAGGHDYAAAVLEDGTVEMWGSNNCGQLEVKPEATEVKCLAAGQRYTLALKHDGTAVGWGKNDYGQCDIPAALDGTSIKAIAAYRHSSAVLTEDNKIVVWGRCNYKDSEFKFVDCDKDIVAIAMNGSHILALAADGTVEAWKWYSNILSVTVPDGFSNDVLAITAGTSHALALKTDGSVVCWGNSVPDDLTEVRAITAGDGFSAALCRDGTLTVWGADNNGIKDVPPLKQVEAITAGSYDMYALQADGKVVAWGKNDYGQGNVPNDLDLFSTVSINDRLTSLMVETDTGVTCGIYPKFGCEQTDGIVDIAYDVKEVSIKALPCSKTATLTINGKEVPPDSSTVIHVSDLKVGDNPIEIMVTAASGSQRSYTLHIKRVNAGYELPDLPLTPQAYQESNYAAYARRLADSRYHFMAIKKDGTIIAWGQGVNGSSNIPSGLDKVVAVAAGDNHSLALQEDGTVVAWGKDSEGQCYVPDNLGDVVDISANSDFSAYLTKNGKVYIVGKITDKECEILDNLGDVVDIECGVNHVLALRADGTVKAWGGDNIWGQCDVPPGLDHVVAIAAGFRHSAALKDDGTMVVWGAEDPKYEIKNPDLQYIKNIASNKDYIVALKWDGSPVVLGSNYAAHAEWGIPLELKQEILVISGNYDNLLGLYEDGTLNAWGEEKHGVTEIPAGLNIFEDDEPPYSGETPDIPQTPADYAASDYVLAAGKICTTQAGVFILNMDSTVRFIPTANEDSYNLAGIPENLDNVTAIASSDANMMALQEDGTVTVWGIDEDDQCKVPTGAQGVIAIAATGDPNTSCMALTHEGRVMVWGNNDEGQCNVPDNLEPVVAIAAGNKHCLALQENGRVRAWGNNECKQCNVPEGLSDNVARIFAAGDLSLALKEDGTVVAWGSNKGSMGTDTYYCGQCDIPEGLSGVVDIYTDGKTCIALKNNGTIAVWGDNQYGLRNVPEGLHNVAAIAGANGVTAIKTDGTVVNWGCDRNYRHELTGLSSVLTVSNKIIIFRDGTLRYYPDDEFAGDANEMLNGLNVISGHYFVIDEVELLDKDGKEISSVVSPGGYRIEADVDNNYGSPVRGLAIIQVRAGDSADCSSGGQVMGCIGVSSVIPESGSSVSSDFNMPKGVSGKAYVDVFVWEDWKTMVPRASANHSLNFPVNN